MRLSSCISLDLLYIHNGDEASENSRSVLFTSAIGTYQTTNENLRASHCLFRLPAHLICCWATSKGQTVTYL